MNGLLLDYEGNSITEGARVELHPGTAAWMSGDRFGTVERITSTVVALGHEKVRRYFVIVRMNSGLTRRLHHERVRVVKP